MSEPAKNWRDDRRQAILDVAFRTFLEKGYAESSMAEIAARLGGSKTTLYHYFPSKDDLFLAVAEAESQRTTQRLNAFVEPQGDARAVLTAFGEHFVATVCEGDKIAYFRMIVAEAVRFPQVGRIFYQACIDRAFDHASAFIGRMMADGRLRPGDARTAAITLLDLCTGNQQMKWLLGISEAVVDTAVARHVAASVDAFMAIYGRKP
jgi:TetR/AcrR family transcriptional regulator, mexJK operon transcriptional repressor